jgi:AAA domain
MTRVLYLARENPDDVRMRWLAMSEALGFDVDEINVHFVPGVSKLSAIKARITAELEKIGEVSLVIVDTSAAFNECSDENDNVQMGLHARSMRELVKLPGGPCVVVACHPVKNAQVDALLPRGGGAFVAEVDGNLTATKRDSVITLHWQGKFRGPDFTPIPFQVSSATTDRLRDSKGRTIPTVIAKPMSERERIESEANTRTDEADLLIAIADSERASFAGLATALGWVSSKGENKTKVKRCVDRLKADKLVKSDRRGAVSLSDKEMEEVKRLKLSREMAGGRSG